MNRRGFFTLLAGAAVARPAAARAQQRDQLRTVGVLMNYAEPDPEGQARLAALRQELHRLGWMEQASIRIDVRWVGGKADLMRTYAAALIGLRPDILVVNSTPSLAALKPLAGTIPIV